MKNPIRSSLILLSMLGVYASHTAHAYTVKKCDGNNIVWPKPESNHPAPDAAVPFRFSSLFTDSWQDAMRTSMDRWNAGPQALSFSSTTGDTNVGGDNGQNEIWWTDTGSAGLTVSYFFCKKGQYVEADIMFNNTMNWTTSESKGVIDAYGGSKTSFQHAAIHELGHVIGLDHTTTTYNIMAPTLGSFHFNTNGSTANVYVGEDTTNGGVHLYGATYMWKNRDLAVTHWKFKNEDRNERTKIYDTSGNVVSSFNDGGEPRYRLNKGQTYSAEFTYENLTYYDASDVEVAYYISDNDYITYQDRLLRTFTITLNFNTVYTSKKNFTVPSDLISGNDYHLGVIVNHDREVVLEQPGNNEAYIGIRIN